VIIKAPRATPVSTWYHQYIAYPDEALCAAIAHKEYTLTDRRTWLSLTFDPTGKAAIYKQGGNLLLNPAHLLISKAQDPSLAE